MRLVDRYFIKKPLVRKMLTRWRYGDKDKNIKLLHTRLYINTIKENGYLRAAKLAFKSNVFRYEASTLINLATFLSDDTTFVDIGANVGLYSSIYIRFKNLYSNFRIYAFEPNPDTFKRLEKTISGMGIMAFNVALSNAETELSFVQGIVSHVFAEKTYIRPHHLKHQKTITINAKRLDQFNVEGKSLVLKIDVEGHEFEVLEGAKAFFDATRIKAIYLDGCNKRKEVSIFLKDYGFTLYNGKSFEQIQDSDFSLIAVHKGFL